MRFGLVIFIVAGLTGLLSCVKPDQSLVDQSSNLVDVTVDSVKPMIYKITFTPRLSTWDAEAKSKVALFNVYRKSANSSNRTNVGMSFGVSAPGLALNNTYFYKNNDGKIEQILYRNENFIFDTLNDRNKDSYVYGASAVTRLSAGAAGVDFANGLESDVTYNPKGLESGFDLFLTINNRALATPFDTVTVSGVFDTNGIDSLVYYRYSEVMPLDTVSTWLPRIAAHFSVHDTFVISGTYKLVVDDSGVVWLRGFSGYSDTNSHLFGRLLPPDTVAKTALSSLFDDFNVSDLGRVEFSKHDTLVTGLGKKWVVLKGLRTDDNASKDWVIVDEISIATYQAALSLDFNAPGLRTVTNELEKKICLLNDSIPIVFNGYSDITFDDTVYFWVATRNYSALFFTPDSPVITNASIVAHYPGQTDRTFPDCILESVPIKTVLGSQREAALVLAPDYREGYRVSPLGTLEEMGKKSPTLGVKDVVRTNVSPSMLARTVKPGSILGYSLDRLDKFDTSRVYSYAIKNTQVMPGLSWHTVRRDTAGLSEYFLSYDSIVYVNDFRSIPLNTDEAYVGSKEFIIIAYAKGRYFKEPRIFFSTFNSSYRYVWDKVPPRFSWSKQYDPLVYSIYAPLYYRDPANASNDKITNLAALHNIFNVSLESDFKEEKCIKAAVRDAGFGRIKSVTVMFHYAGPIDASRSNPATNERVYKDGTPIKQYKLDEAQVRNQAQGQYYSGNTRKGYGMANAYFTNIDATYWESGVWDMWVVTEDDIGNRGMASYGGNILNKANGDFMTRKIEIK